MPPQEQNQFNPQNSVPTNPPEDAHQGKKSKKWIWVTVAVAILLAILIFIFSPVDKCGCGLPIWWPMKCKCDISTTSDQFADWKTYRNEEYGFELKFPENWNGVKEEVWKDDCNGINFYLPSSEKKESDLIYPEFKNYTSVLTIVVCSLFQFKNTNEFLKPNVLYQNNEFIFVYYKETPVPKDLENAYKNIDQILSTFKFISTSTQTSIKNITYPKEEKGLWMKLNLMGDKITLLKGPKKVDGYPNFLPGSYFFIAKIISSNGNVLGEYGFNDPRNVNEELGYEGPTKLESSDFDLIIPYFPDSKRMSIFKSGELIFSLDISF